MNSVAAILALGFVLGMRHATDPDHVIAVTTIVARQRKAGSAALIGGLWGLGHTLTIVLVGSGIILFRWVISPRLGLSMEFAVALMLIVLGILNLTGVVGDITETPASSEVDQGTGNRMHHAHHHAHGDYVHKHQHTHEPEAHPHAVEQTPVAWLDRQLGALGVYQSVRPIVVGIIHGLAGSAAVALLVLATISDPRWSMLYLLVFGLGTIAGMMLTTAVIAVPFQYTSASSVRWNRRLRVASGLLSLGFGLFIAYRIGIVQGLFGGTPVWTPR
jgi:high-affinity nickel-transport protein